MAETIFSKIIAGDIPCHRVYEDEHVLAFLDINPLSKGHTLVIPKQPAERLEQLTPESAAAIGAALPMVAQKVLKITGAAGYNVLQNNGTVSGQEVMHVHFHIIPRSTEDSLGYRWHPKTVTQEELAALASELQSA